MTVVVPRDADLDNAIDRLCVLEDPVRRQAYLTVRGGPRPLSRTEVAEATRISVRLATFHLEKLVVEGYLEAEYPTEPSGRPGHPAKRYRPSDLELEVTVPPRRYDLIAEILSDAWQGSDAARRGATLDDVAVDYGRRVGARTRPHRGESRFITALRLVGYEPVTVGDDVVLRNCPFHRAAQARPHVVCGINEAFVRGLLEGAGTTERAGVLDRAPGRCCVLVRPSRDDAAAPASTAARSRTPQRRPPKGTERTR
jgi:predicted ArsR family transcriptional regulator